MWTVEYKTTERGPWIPTGIIEDDAHEAWHTFSVRVMVRDLVYVMAQAFGPPASMASVGQGRP